MTFLPATNTNPYDYEAKGRTDHAAGTKNEKLYGSSEDHGAAYRRGWQQARREAPEVGAAPALAPPPQGGEDALRVHGGDPEVGGTRLPEGSPDAAAGSDPGPLTRKPPYRVPLMAEIAALPWNGFTAVSTFSGCGGSSLGYKLAGFRVAWASEFIPAAQETYRANHPATILDCRDIREVKAEDILAATGLAVGEIDLFDGSPPCASFSTAGIREDGWGQGEKVFRHGAADGRSLLRVRAPDQRDAAEGLRRGERRRAHGRGREGDARRRASSTRSRRRRTRSSTP
jgi:hypothetical protein